MSGFQKRVALLEKWVPSLLPQLKNIDDMAEIILDVWDEAEAYTEQRIIKLLEEIDERNYQPCEHSPKDYSLPCGGCQPYLEPKQVIELIKGETNE